MVVVFCKDNYLSVDLQAFRVFVLFLFVDKMRPQAFFIYGEVVSRFLSCFFLSKRVILVSKTVIRLSRKRTD